MQFRAECGCPEQEMKDRRPPSQQMTLMKLFEIKVLFWCNWHPIWAFHHIVKKDAISGVRARSGSVKPRQTCVPSGQSASERTANPQAACATGKKRNRYDRPWRAQNQSCRDTCANHADGANSIVSLLPHSPPHPCPSPPPPPPPGFTPVAISGGPWFHSRIQTVFCE